MSAKLHLSMAANRLTVVNRSSGEVSLYYPGPSNEKLHLIVSSSKEPLDLLQFAPLAAWKRSTNLTLAVDQGRLDVVL